MIAKFRVMRQHCHLMTCEVAAAANISPQRLNQFETRYYGFKPKNPERLIVALEKIIAQRKKEIEAVERICKYERETIFDYVKDDEKL